MTVIIPMEYPFSHVVPPSDDVLNTLLDKTKGRLFFKKGAGYLGSLLCDMRIIWDDEQPTAYTDGNIIGINRQFFYWLTPEERCTLLAHELWHPGFDHIDRFTKLGPSACPDTFNQAADHVINLMLQSFGYVFGEKLMSLKPCIDPQFKDMATEQVYDILFKQKPPPPPSMGQNPGSCPQGSSNNGQAPQQGSQNQSQQGQGSSQGNDPNLANDLRKAPEGQDRATQVGKLVKARQASRMSQEAGVIPGEVELIIDEFLNPILPWEVLLQKWYTALSNEDFSYRRPNRRFEDEYLPSMLGEDGLEHLYWYFDVSGSVQDPDILRMNSEVKHIHDNIKPQQLTVVTFDTEIQDVYHFNDDDSFEKIVIHGRGGTDLEPVRRHILKHRPTAAVIMSDLHVKPMTQDPKIPILWIVVGNKRAKPAFGQTIHIDSEYKISRATPGGPVTVLSEA